MAAASAAREPLRVQRADGLVADDDRVAAAPELAISSPRRRAARRRRDRIAPRSASRRPLTIAAGVVALIARRLAGRAGAAHFVDDAAERQAFDVDDDGRRLDGRAARARRSWLAQARLGVGDLQQRPAPVAAQAAPESVGAGAQVDAARAPAQQARDFRPQQDAPPPVAMTAGLGCDEGGEDLAASRSLKAASPSRSNSVRDRASAAQLDLLVAVDEAPSSRRATSLPTVDLPPPGMPISETTAGSGLSSGSGRASVTLGIAGRPGMKVGFARTQVDAAGSRCHTG